jgi:hypothetical protein
MQGSSGQPLFEYTDTKGKPRVGRLIREQDGTLTLEREDGNIDYVRAEHAHLLFR